MTFSESRRTVAGVAPLYSISHYMVEQRVSYLYRTVRWMGTTGVTYHSNFPSKRIMYRPSENGAILHKHILRYERKCRLHIAYEALGWRGDGRAQSPKPVQNTFFRDVGVVEQRGVERAVRSLVNAHFALCRGVVDKPGFYVGDVGVPA
jgi:hypothetical protein